jgi:hypothetical protein
VFPTSNFLRWYEAAESKTRDRQVERDERRSGHEAVFGRCGEDVLDLVVRDLFLLEAEVCFGQCRFKTSSVLQGSEASFGCRLLQVA